MSDTQNPQGEEAETHGSSSNPTQDNDTAPVVHDDAQPGDSWIETQASAPFDRNDNAPLSATYGGNSDASNIACGQPEETQNLEHIIESTEEYSFIPAQLAEEQDLEVDVRRIPRPMRQRRTRESEPLLTKYVL